MMKGDSDFGSVQVMGAVIGIVLIVIAIIMVVAYWNDISQTQCWRDASEQIDNLCLSEKSFCSGPEPGQTLYREVRFGDCVKSVAFVDGSKIQDEIIALQIKGEESSCSMGKNSYIIILPNSVDWGIVDTVTNPIEAWRKTNAESICKSYSSTFSGVPLNLRGPEEGKTVTYCIMIDTIDAQNTEESYHYKISAKEGKCVI